MPGTTPSQNPPQAVIRDGDFLWFVSLAEAREIHKHRGARWLPKKFPVHRNETGHTFIDNSKDGTCAHCRAGGVCKPVAVSAVDITPSASPRVLKSEDEHLYDGELRELLGWLPSRLRMEIEKFDIKSLTRPQMQRLAQEASKALRAHEVPWVQPDGSKTFLLRTERIPFAEIIRGLLGRAKAGIRGTEDVDFGRMSEPEIRAWIHDRVVEAGGWDAVDAAVHRAAVKQALMENGK